MGLTRQHLNGVLFIVLAVQLACVCAVKVPTHYLRPASTNAAPALDDSALDSAIDALASSEETGSAGEEEVASADDKHSDDGDDVDMTVQDVAEGAASETDRDAQYGNESDMTSISSTSLTSGSPADLTEAADSPAVPRGRQGTVSAPLAVDFESSPSAPYTTAAVVNSSLTLTVPGEFPQDMWTGEGFTISMKVKMAPRLTDTAVSQVLCDRGQGGLIMNWFNKTLFVAGANTELDPGFRLPTQLDPDSSHYIGVTVASGATPSRKLFIDGVAVMEDTSVPTFTGGGPQITLGSGNADHMDSVWKGGICSFKLWRGVLTATEMHGFVLADSSSRSADQCGPVNIAAAPSDDDGSDHDPDHPPGELDSIPSPYILTSKEERTYIQFDGQMTLAFKKLPPLPLGVSARSVEMWVNPDAKLLENTNGTSASVLCGWGNWTHELVPKKDPVEKKPKAVWSMELRRGGGDNSDQFYVYVTGMSDKDIKPDGPAASKISLPAGEWSHLAVVWTGREIRVLVNGQKVFTANVSYPEDEPPFFTRPDSFYISGKPVYHKLNQRVGMDSLFSGGMREVRVWDAALDDVTVRQYMRYSWPCGAPGWKWSYFYHPFAKHLVGMWAMNEGVGNTVQSCAYHLPYKGTAEGQLSWKEDAPGEGVPMRPGPGPQVYLRNHLPRVEPHQALFNYDPSDSKMGPNGWLALDSDCGKMNQSPINIRADGAVDADPQGGKAPRLRVLYQSSLDSQIRGDAYSLSVYHNRVSVVTLNNEVYHLREVRFHTPSEHQFNGQNFDGEIQLVHENKEGRFSYGTGDYSLLVISVFLQKGGQSNKYVSTVLKYLPDIDGGNAHVREPLNPLLLLPKEDSRPYYEYQGRITTPPCSLARWFVMQTPIHVSDHEFDVLHKHLAVRNTRPIQDTNNRTIYRGKMPSIDLSAEEWNKKTR